MELIIDFYKSLDTLNLIIFWGIIIIIILLLIFSLIMINKNKKLKKIVENNVNKYEEDIPIKKEEKIFITNKEDKLEENLGTFQNETEKNNIEEEKKFVAEEHVIEYNQENSSHNHEEFNNDKFKKKSIEMPTGPYQRNVLREMSLSQTSPIGINKQVRNEEKKIEILNDLEESLNIEKTDDYMLKKEEINRNHSNQELKTQIKKEISNNEKNFSSKTETSVDLSLNDKKTFEERKLSREITQKKPETKHSNQLVETSATEILNSQTILNENIKEKNSSEKYLEEVSKKLAEAEIPDEIERTNYELEQEENAIISYKELMEKKDSIQTIDDEDAVISIEELMNRSTQKEIKQSDINQTEAKFYNLTEEEENDNFIKELKQFRSDL